MNLLQMSFFGAILILAVIVVRAVFINKLPKRTFLVLWVIVLLRLLIPFSIPSIFSVYSLVNRSIPVRETVSDVTISDFTPTAQPGQLFIGGNTVQAQMPQDVQDNIHVSVLSIIWCVGTISCAAFFTMSYLRLSFEFKTSLPVSDTFITQWLEEHQLKRLVTIRQSSSVQTPLTYGILHPVILMPQKTTDWENKQQLQYILLHEYVHICRYDVAAKLISVFALCIHWFNPMVWVMYILINRDIELACDECVIRKFGEESKSEYALTLISMEEKRSGLLPICNNFSKNAIEERITAVMKIKKTSFAAIIVAVALVASVTTAFATSGVKNEDCISIANKSLDSIISDYGKIDSIVYTGFVDFSEPPIEINDVQYYLIENDCNSLDELVQLISNVYTEEQTEKILLWCTDGDDPLIIEHEGKLWRQDAYATGTPFILPVNEAKKVDNNTIEVVTDLDGNEDFIVKITLKIEGNKWKIDEIEEVEKEQ